VPLRSSSLVELEHAAGRRQERAPEPEKPAARVFRGGEGAL